MAHALRAAARNPAASPRNRTPPPGGNRGIVTAVVNAAAKPSIARPFSPEFPVASPCGGFSSAPFWTLIRREKMEW